MKTIKLTLAMAALALGATAFAFSGHTDPVKPTKETTYYYRNNGGGVYSQISASEADPNEHCGEISDPNLCIVTSATNTSTFTLGPGAPTDLAPVPGAGNYLYQ